MLSCRVTRLFTHVILSLDLLPFIINAGGLTFFFHGVSLIEMTYYERYREPILFDFNLLSYGYFRHREARKAYQRTYSATHPRAARRKINKVKREAGGTRRNVDEAMQSTRYVCWLRRLLVNVSF
jgi:hypothetical protein